MLDQASSTEYERDLARLRELRQAVLLHLISWGLAQPHGTLSMFVSDSIKPTR